MIDRLLGLLVAVMWWRYLPPVAHAYLRDQHTRLLDWQMARRRKKGIVELKTGVYWMSPEELDEHSRNL